jgi:hypothetical protein
MRACTVDLSKLAPAEMAQLLGKPEGEAGSALGEMLNRTNASVTEAVYQRLHFKPGDHVLEIGFGNGKLQLRQTGAHWAPS